MFHRGSVFIYEVQECLIGALPYMAVCIAALSVEYAAFQIINVL